MSREAEDAFNKLQGIEQCLQCGDWMTTEKPPSAIFCSVECVNAHLNAAIAKTQGDWEKLGGKPYFK